MNCANCNGKISSEDVALTMKMINRGATTYYCKKCLAEKFSTTEEKIDELIEVWKKQGCTLFK